MAEVIIFPKHQERQFSSEDYIATMKRVLAEKGFPDSKSKGQRVSVAAMVEILPQVIRDLREVMECAGRDAREGRETLAFLIGMYEHLLDECPGHGPCEGWPMDNAKSEAIGAPAEAAKHAKVFETSESLSSWLLGLVDEWSERDGKVYSVAEGGLCIAERGENTEMEASIFEVIEDQVGDTFYATELRAGIARLQELARARQAIGAHQ